MTKRPLRIKHEINVEFDRLLFDEEHGRLPRHLSKAMTRPAYAYTSMQQKKDIQAISMCQLWIFLQDRGNAKGGVHVPLV